ncbi:MAG TPA: methyltransferase domain-containing protein [Chthoniobacterales bacterium]|jgi:tRNA (mo5U34)-methyltransferase|nr:methyltransferase domain-containing protein [Chthoniobacterales bacterium]
MSLDQDKIWWWHSIELPDGTITPGEKTLSYLKTEWERMALPDLTGKTLLDIGAWDGWFSFEAEKHGAARVVALDQFVWALDFSEGAKYAVYVEECKAAGRPAAPWGPACPFWEIDTLPGQRGFKRAHEAFRSKVEPVVANFMETDVSSIGSFDIVLFLGVLYHLQEPLTALRRLRQLTNELAVVETEAIEVFGYEDRAMLRFTPGAEVNNDSTNWWFPNELALKGLLATAGFSHYETTGRTSARSDGHYRLTMQARP